MKSGKDFVRACQDSVAIVGGTMEATSQEQVTDAALCQGFITGATQVISTSATGKYENGPIRICTAGKKFPILQVAKEIDAMAREKPDLIAEVDELSDAVDPPTMLTLVALQRIAPCRD